MAVSVISPVSGLFDPATRDTLNLSTVLQLAIFPQPQFPKGVALATQGGSLFATEAQTQRAQRRTAKAMLAKMAGRRASDFVGTFDTSNADALASAFSLTTKGVTFPAASLRTITLRMVSTNDAESIHQVVEQDVWGNNGTTPVLGDARLVEAYKIVSGVYVKMGRTHCATDVAGTERTDGMSNSGFTTAAATNGTGAMVVPAHRAVRVIGAHYAADTYNAATGCVAHISTIAAAGTARLDVAAADDGLADTTPGAGRLDVALELWPVAQCALVLNTNAVEVHIRTTLADIYRHKLEAYIGPAISNTLSA